MVNKYKSCRNPKEFIDILYQNNYSRLLHAVSSQPDCTLLSEHLVQEVFFEMLRRFDYPMLAEDPDRWLTETLQIKIELIQRKQKLQDADEHKKWREEMRLLWEKYGSVDLSCVNGSNLNGHEKLLFQMYYLECNSLAELARLERASSQELRAYLDQILLKLL